MRYSDTENDESIPILSSTWGEDVFTKLSWFRLDRLKQAKVMVVGCGALGNEVLKNLALFGVGHLVIVDFDTVEPSNLTRSVLFRLADAESGKAKVEVAAERLREINPAIRVLPIQENINHGIGLGLLRRMDVVVGCVDNRWARYCLNRLCMRAGIPWVDGGIEALEGTARVFMPGKNCYACNLGPEALKDLSYRLSCTSVIRRDEQAGRVPTTPVVASIIGAVQAQETIKLLHSEELDRGELTSLCGKMFYYEGQHLSSRVVDFEGYDQDCPLHECWKPIEKMDITTEWHVGDVLAYLSKRLGCGREVEVSLGNHSFVDYLVVKDDDRRVYTLLPSYDVERFVDEEPTLRHLPYHALYQHEIRTLDVGFPYQELTLKQVGIPSWDVLQIKTDERVHYVELSDECGYSQLLS